MDRFKEMIRFKEIGDPVQCFIVDEDCAEQRLFGFNVVGGHTIGWFCVASLKADG